MKPYNNSTNLSNKLKSDESGWELVERPASAKRYPQDESDKYAWYLQGNKVAVARPLTHNVIWSVAENETEGNEGAGKGDGFLDELRAGDRVLVWARARVRVHFFT